MASSQLRGHLRKYVEDGIQQKVRLNNLITDYADQEYKTRERVIDQTTLETSMTTDGIDPSKIALVTERKKRDQDILARIQKTITQSKVDLEGITFRMNAHLEELTDIEMATGGFVTHAVGADENVTLDKENMIIKFVNGGHVEIPIAARLIKWKDSSQLTINKIKK